MSVHERPVGASVDWFTPHRLFVRLGLTYDLDPAAGRSPADLAVNMCPAERFYTAEDDGLSMEWHGRVWLNPPYGPRGVRFVERMIEHGNGVLLLPARTETRIFQRAVIEATGFCLLRDRLHFVRPDGTSGRASFGSVLFAFGGQVAQAIRAARLGVYVHSAGVDWRAVA